MAHDGRRPTLDIHSTQGANLSREAAGWATPRAEERGQYQRDRGDKTKPRATLTGQAKGWSTPAAQDAKNSTLPPSLRGRDSVIGNLLAGQPDPESPSTTGKPRGSLNSRWVSQLMGFPSNWCELPIETLSKATATPSSRKSPKSSGSP
jgi:hypothetical protein